MNASLLNIVKSIVAEQGEDILSDPRRISAFFADLAKDEPKPHKNALIKCLEHGFAQILKNASEQERPFCKQKLAQRLHDEEGLDPALCADTLELLDAVSFVEQKQTKNYTSGNSFLFKCKNCGKDLQEEWKTCPYCLIIIKQRIS